MNSTVQVEETAIKANGFAIVPDVFTPAEMTDLAAKLETSTLSRTRAGVRHVLRQPTVERIANDPRLINITRAILGPESFPFHATLFEKSLDSNWLIVWHQDTALPLEMKNETLGWGPWSVKDGVTYAHAPATALERVLAIRVHIDPSMENNGPLRVLPQTHNRGVLTDDQIEKLSKKVSPFSCIVGHGGIVLMHPLLVHASSKSTSSLNRRVLHIEYAAQAGFDGLRLARA